MAGNKPKGEEVAPGWFFRPMSAKDVPAVLSIIETHDEDEAEWVAETYNHLGHQGQFVLTQDTSVAGVSGYALANGTDKAYWISWTYLDKACQSLGTALLERLLQELREEGARKVFVSTSDYEEKGTNIYANAVRLYESAGFQLEVKTPDFYGTGESQLIYGLTLDDAQPPPIEFAGRNERAIELTHLFRIDETEDSAGLDWDFTESGESFGAEDLALQIDEARRGEAHCLFVSFASDLTQVNAALERCQMRESGRLKDFWANGIDDVRYAFTFGQ